MHLFSFQELQSQLSLRVHEKVTYAGRMKAKQGDLLRELREGLEEDTAQPGGEESSLAQQQNTPAWRVAMIKGAHTPTHTMLPHHNWHVMTHTLGPYTHILYSLGLNTKALGLHWSHWHNWNNYYGQSSALKIQTAKQYFLFASAFIPNLRPIFWQCHAISSWWYRWKILTWA